MSCGSWWNHHIAHTWHSILYLIAVLTVWKASNSLPSQLLVLKTSLKTSISFALSNPLTSHFVLLSPHLTLCFVQPSSPCIFSLPFDLVVFSFLLSHSYCSCHWLNFHSLRSSCIVPYFCYLLLRLLTVALGDYYYSPQYHTLRASKGASALIQPSFTHCLQSQLCHLGISTMNPIASFSNGEIFGSSFCSERSADSILDTILNQILVSQVCLVS